jgi:hypothetical protein
MYDLKYSTIGCTNATTTPFGDSKGSLLGSSATGLVVTMLCDGILMVKCTSTST